MRAAHRDLLEKLGAKIPTSRSPHTQYAIAAYYLVATAEASSNLARYDGVRYGHRATDATGLAARCTAAPAREGFGAEVKRRIMLGTYALSAGYYDAYYLRAQKVRTLIRRDFERAFESVDAIVTPTSPTAGLQARREDDRPAADVPGRHLHHLLQPRRRCPGLSLPCGFTDGGLPIGVQLLGRPFDEATLLARGPRPRARTEIAHAARPRAGRDGEGVSP